MNYNKNNAENVKIAYIGGGSRGWAWGLMSDLVSQEDMSGSVYLYDIDCDAAKNNEIIGNKSSLADGAKSRWEYVAAQTVGEALTGADFTVLSILPGTFDEMYSDVHEPEKYGIYQSVGDTAGPGGILRAMRTIPMYVDIAEAIKKYAPDTWVINYTNPMSLCVWTLYRIFPGIKAFGCCHEVFGTQELLADALREMRGTEGVKRSDICINVQGINHFTWINKANYRDIDLFDVYREFVDKFYETGYISDNSDHWINNSFACAHRVKFDLFRRYGNIAAAGDRHLAEFMPGRQYLNSPETVREWKFGLTTVDWRKEDLKKRLDKSAELVSGKQSFEIKNTGEEGVNQMKALLGLSTLVTNVNIPNMGQIPNLPLGAVVETNAVFRHNSLTPVFAGSMDNDIAALTLRHVYNHKTVLDGVLDGDRDKVFTAFLNDPLMTADRDSAKVLFDAMCKNTEKYLKF
ncbi:MAG: alpha-glucosidase/alpha-galactosidase [Oscillospiraceae bacterium]|nr:alpha-glucosidase/alpha-galactosidase [Oscillospiraceae bacterium]